MGRAKNTRIKKAHTEHEFTPTELSEFIKCSTDPIYFCKNYVKVQHPKLGAIPLELYDYQEQMMKMYMDCRFSIILSSRQTGKALALDTQIATPTPEGFTAMGDLKVGDYVIGGDGKTTRIKWVSDVQHNRKCYRVKFTKGEEIVADADHLWLVQDDHAANGREYVMTTQAMLDKGLQYQDSLMTANSKNPSHWRFSIKNAEPLEMPDLDLPYDPYGLGVWLAKSTGNKNEVAIATRDVKLFKTWLQRRYGRAKVRGYVDKSVGHSANRLHIAGLEESFAEAGVTTRRIPRHMFRASYDQRLELVQGFLDAGSTIRQRKILRAEGIEAELAHDLEEMMITLGYRPCMHKVLGLETWRMSVPIDNETARLILYPHKSKGTIHRLSARTIRHRAKRCIVAIEPVESVPVKCIAVENEDHTYLVGRNLIKTHNSTVSAIYLLWFAMFNPDKTILIASNKNKGAMEMVQRIRYAYEELPMFLKPGVSDDGWSKHTVAFDNGSRIESTATSENSGRGMSISLLFLDEFAFVPPAVQEEFWTSILPTLSTGGSCIMSSTPNGDSDLFAQLWRAADCGTKVNEEALNFVPLHVKWNAPPGRGAAFKATQMRLLGELKWRQEYECVSGDTSITLKDNTGRIFTTSMEELYERLASETAADSQRLHREIRPITF